MTIMSRFLVLCAICCLFISSAHGQIISNSQFHTLNPLSPLNTCSTADVTVATGMNRIQDMCSAWMTPTNGTPDYFYGCDKVPSGTPDYGVPVQTWFTGNCEDPSYPSPTFTEDLRAYAGIELIDNASAASRDREYITQQLNTPLQVGRKYIVSFRVRSSNLRTEYLVKRLGCLLTTNAPTAANTSDANNGALPTTLGDYAEAFNASGWDANSWQYISMEVTITGASSRNYITIGNFQEDIPDAEWVAQPTMPTVPTNGGRGYYFIDDVNICDICPMGVDVEKVKSQDPDKCCYEITFLGDLGEYCSTLTGFRMIKPGIGLSADTLYEHNGGIGGPYNVCVDRFTSGQILFELFDENGARCGFFKELGCDCDCDESLNPPGLSIGLVRDGGSPDCCWNIVVNQYHTSFPKAAACDAVMRGIVINAGPSASFYAGTGYTLTTTPGGTPYLTINDTDGGDIYMDGTSTVIGRICLPQNSVDFPITFKVLKEIGDGGQEIYCGSGFDAEVSCADECCSEVWRTDLRSTTSPDPLKCCFAIDIILGPHKCLSLLTVQVKNGASWGDESTIPLPSVAFSIQQCITLGTQKEIRLQFKNSAGEVVCMREFSLKCEDDCCSRVKELYAYRTSQNPCCYHVRGYMNGSGSIKCPELYDYVIQQYDPVSGTWITKTSGTPDVNGFFEDDVCINTLSAMIRVLFRDSGGNIVCTRWLHIECDDVPPHGGKGKMGTGNASGSLAEKAYTVPNPAIGETTVHYSLREESNVRISLYNNIGEVVAEVLSTRQTAGPQSTRITTSQLPAGMYFVQISTGDSVLTLPVTVMK